MDYSTSMILDGLFLGDQDAARYAWHKFAVLVNCTPDIPFPSYIVDPSVQQRIRIPVEDNEHEHDAFLRALRATQVLERIHEALKTGRRVLVHCKMGIQRSAALVACYLVVYGGLTTEEAIAYIQERRPQAFYRGATFLDAIRTTEPIIRKRGDDRV
jgi:hypothetical protein